MRWITAKNASEVTLKGVSISFTTEDKTITEILIRDGAGDVVRFARGETYSRDIRAYIPAPPEKKEVFVVRGKLHGCVDINDSFDSEHEARDRLRELQRVDSGADLKMEPVEVVVQEVAAKEPALAEDIPF